MSVRSVLVAWFMVKTGRTNKNINSTRPTQRQKYQLQALDSSAAADHAVCRACMHVQWAGKRIPGMHDACSSASRQHLEHEHEVSPQKHCEQREHATVSATSTIKVTMRHATAAAIRRRRKSNAEHAVNTTVNTPNSTPHVSRAPRAIAHIQQAPPGGVFTAVTA